MRKSILVATVAGAAALSFGALQAQSGPSAIPGQLDTSRIQAGTYKSDKNHSLIGWRINHLGFNDYFGLFGDVDATLTLDPANLAGAKVDATIPINPVLASPELREHLLKPAPEGGQADFFGANPTPAHFVSTKVTPNGNKARIDGNLTLNGVTKPVTINAEFTGAGNAMGSNTPTVGFEGIATIKRSDFGVSTAGPVVSDEVELQLTAAFEKQ